MAANNVGTVYVTDSGHNRVLALATGATQPVELPFTGLNFPAGVAVDLNGNIYVADLNNNRVVRLDAATHEQTVLPFDDLFSPTDVAVDNHGSVYVIDYHDRVLKLPAQSNSHHEP